MIFLWFVSFGLSLHVLPPSSTRTSLTPSLGNSPRRHQSASRRLNRTTAPQTNAPQSERVMDYVITGSWNREAYDEAKRLASFARTNVALDAHSYSKDSISFDTVSPHGESPAPALIYYCENETIDGVPFSLDPTMQRSFPFTRLPHKRRAAACSITRG
ncbi:hypothetical protein BC826DRAFT_431805 [Russula brevipes]|nr:hypothetical protein BC826DRAFT_431805 [Russula brevipes]